MKFCNSHLISEVDMTTWYSPKDDDCDLMRCLNCGMDGEDHLNDMKCLPIKKRRYAHIITPQEFEHVFLDYFLCKVDLVCNRLRDWA